jgi:hypothetical protein
MPATVTFFQIGARVHLECKSEAISSRLGRTKNAYGAMVPTGWGARFPAFFQMCGCQPRRWQVEHRRVQQGPFQAKRVSEPLRQRKCLAGRVVLHNRQFCRGSRPSRRHAQERVGCRNGAVA